MKKLKQDYDDALVMIELANEEEDESLAAREIADFGEAPEIEFRDVSFGYKNGGKVFSEVNLTVAPGEFAAFVGPSGGGKTTLLRLLLGLVKEGNPFRKRKNDRNFFCHTQNFYLCTTGKGNVFRHRCGNAAAFFAGGHRRGNQRRA